jgi:hypothetical protein
MAEDRRFLLAEFADPDAMLRAAKELRQAGWSIEIHSPFPVKGMAEALGFAERRVPRAVLIGGLLGAVTGFAMQVYTNLAYPLDVGGRPLVAVPAFMLITFELTVLFAVIAGIGTMFASNHLPRLHHPLFDSQRFHLASDDRFFVSLALEGRDRDEAGKALAAFDPERIEDLGGEP